jgi:lipopolysaccharide transport system ATP-binding protein
MGQLRVRGLGKAYKRYKRKNGRLLEWMGAAPRHELRWVLHDVSFDIAPGESVGIIGENGAGKSTLLKLLASTTMPTTGTVEIGGSLAALLELGVGFHPDFTGRENVFMAGSIRGLAPHEIAALMPEVEAFAEIGDYLDQPVRTYSSGMQVRLAFSVATCIRPDILIVDEALSVGDIYFQQKCFDRIRHFRDSGTTLLFVSHSLPAVYALCSRALYLENGAMLLDGKPKEAIDLYQARLVERSQREGAAVTVVPPATVQGGEPTEEAEITPSVGPTDPHRATGSYATEGVSIDRVMLRDAAGEPCELFFSSGEMVVEIAAAFDRDVDDPHFGFQVRDRMGQALFMTTTHGLGMRLGAIRAGESRTVRFRFKPAIAPAQYTVTAGIANRGRFDGSFEEALVRHQDVAAFTVVEPADAPRWSGLINLRPTVEVA